MTDQSFFRYQMCLRSEKVLLATVLSVPWSVQWEHVVVEPQDLIARQEPMQTLIAVAEVYIKRVRRNVAWEA